MINARNVFKDFVQGDRVVKVLKGLSFQISEGEAVAIVGKSGSGKSTLLSLLAGFDLPTSGELTLAGFNFSKLKEQEAARARSENLGFVFQQFHLMSHMNLLENVMLPLEIQGDPRAKEKATGLIGEVGLSDRLSHFPAQLSGGECQRVALARALVAKPKVVLADEPTGNLDSQTSGEITELMFKTVRAHRVTLVLVTHSEELAQRCDRQIRLKDGKLEV